MKKQFIYFFVLIGIIAVLGCINTMIGHRPNTNLTKTEVIRIAEETAKANGYDTNKYNMTGCHYEFVHKDNTWTVFFELKPPTPPGGHFLVTVDDQTKKAELAPGE